MPNEGEGGPAGTTGPPIIKALYCESEEVAAWPSAEVEAWRAARKMTVQGSSLKPVPRFELSGGARSAPPATVRNSFRHRCARNISLVKMSDPCRLSCCCIERG